MNTARRAPHGKEGGITGNEPERASITYKGIEYEELIPILVRAIQDQQQTINGLKARVAELEGQ